MPYNIRKHRDRARGRADDGGRAAGMGPAVGTADGVDTGSFGVNGYEPPVTRRATGRTGERKTAGTPASAWSGKPSGDLTSGERDVWSGALMNASIASPILRSALVALHPYRSDVVESVAVDQHWRVGLGPAFFSAEQRERTAMVIHVALHVVLNHYQRAQAARQVNGELSAKAQDIEINQMISTLAETNVKLPAGSATPKSEDVPKDQSMEDYYKILWKRAGMGQSADAAEGRDGDGGDPQGGRGDDRAPGSATGSLLPDNGRHGTGDHQMQDGNQGAGARNGDDAHDGDRDGTGGRQGGGFAARMRRARQQNQDGQGGGAGTDSGEGRYGPDGDDARGDRNGGATSDHTRNQTDGDGHGNGDDSRTTDDGSGRRPNRAQGPCGESEATRLSEEADKLGIERAEIHDMVAAKTGVVNAAKKTAGMPGNSAMDKALAVTITHAMKPLKVDWRGLFRRVMTKAQSQLSYKKTDYSYTRVNRRDSTFMPNVIFPAMVGYKPKVLMAVDTSASMRESDLRKALLAAEGIIRETGKGAKGAFSAFCVDTRMKDVKCVTDVSKLDLKGGGGTDMAPAFAYAAGLPKSKRPDIFVLVTDGGLSPERWEKIKQAWPRNITCIILITNEKGMQRVPAWANKVGTVIDVSTPIEDSGHNRYTRNRKRR